MHPCPPPPLRPAPARPVLSHVCLRPPAPPPPSPLPPSRTHPLFCVVRKFLTGHEERPFDTDAFVSDHSREDRPFIQEFVTTCSFEHFIDDRVAPQARPRPSVPRTCVCALWA